ncbi:MAG: hypothetical protein OZ921_08400 [Sorangiineae bacterium]|nr:hypothetical protein [Polyangiaceae bacterium]MEB2322520.1 hypothetical protein [Sorangiineae bacterium]
MRAALALAVALAVSGCKKPYRVGEYVLVEWDGRDYPAYIIEEKSASRFRVHFEGYSARWDDDVSLERIHGRITGPVTPPPPPRWVALASGAPSGAASAAPVSPYRIGDRVRVTWRGSTYNAAIIDIESPTRVRVHYEGLETAWDETVDTSRIVSRR